MNVMKLRPELAEEIRIFSAKLNVLFLQWCLSGPTRCCRLVGIRVLFLIRVPFFTSVDRIEVEDTGYFVVLA